MRATATVTAAAKRVTKNAGVASSDSCDARCMRALTIVIVMFAASPVRADAPQDVTHSFQAFVDGIAANKPDVAGVDVLISPWGWTVAPDAATIAALHDQLVKPRLAKVVVFATPTAAWLAADVSAVLPSINGGGGGPGVLRASAVLDHDAKGWHVRVAQLSRAAANDATPHERCETTMPSDIEAGATSTPAQAAIDALDAGKLSTVISTDKQALMIGSAPNERLTGPAIAKLFTKLVIERSPRDGKKAAFRAGSAGDLVWVVLPTWAPKYCVEYLTLFVLRKESGSWKIIHQHYEQVSLAGVL